MSKAICQSPTCAPMQKLADTCTGKPGAIKLCEVIECMYPKGRSAPPWCVPDERLMPFDAWVWLQSRKRIQARQGQTPMRQPLGCSCRVGCRSSRSSPCQGLNCMCDSAHSRIPTGNVCGIGIRKTTNIVPCIKPKAFWTFFVATVAGAAAIYNYVRSLEPWGNFIHNPAYVTQAAFRN